MKLLSFLGLCMFSCLAFADEQKPNDGWRPVFSDDFNRQMIGPNWCWVFGDGRKYIRENAIHISHSATVYCLVPLPYQDSRVEFDLLLPSNSFSGKHPHAISLALRGGEVGGGGKNERFEAIFIPESEKAGTVTNPDGTAKDIDPDTIVPMAIDQNYHVVMQISDGIGSVSVNGKLQFQKNVIPATSEVNRYFVFSTIGMNGVPGKEVVLDNFKIYAGPKAVEKLPLRPNSAEENRKATCRAADFIDPSNPAVGIQKAVDSLPPNGGLVILPEGEFLMRRHIRLRSNVTLCGQGAGKTVLRACKGEGAAILEMKNAPGECKVTVAPADALKFMPGDGVCFDENWGHPGSLDSINKDCVVLDVSGNVITVSGRAPAQGAKTLSHWFSQIYAHCAEFVELKDMSIVSGADGWGNFLSAAVNFGQTAGARVSRIHIPGWRADGISLQTGGDAIITDNTVNNAQLGFHPGTITQRFLWTRNVSLGNWSGLYFCYFNRNGIYHQGTVDQFTGYAWPRDVFDIITRNLCLSDKDFTIEQGEGGGGIIFNNQFPRMKVGHGQETSPTFDFLVADNRVDSIGFVKGLVERNMFAGNLIRTGNQPSPIADKRDKNFFSDESLGLDLSRFTIGAGRDTPVESPALPKPVLDGASFYHPEKPDAGFQEGLNQLAKTGGTFLLPAGRYALSQPLTVPSGVTLAGCGLGTVLHAAKPEQTNSLIAAKQADFVAIRDLVILGEYGRRAFRSAAIALDDVKKVELTAVDVRGWEGTAVKALGGAVQVCDCRALACASNGFDFLSCQLDCVGNISRECGNGFVLSKVGPGSVMEANISGGNRGNGYQIDQSEGLLFYTNNSSFNYRDGVSVTNTDKSDFVANMLDNNNQSSAEGCGIRLSGNTKDCRLYYNNFQDEQQQPTQTDAVVEEVSAGGNTIRFNLSRMPFQIKGNASTVSDNAIIR